MEDVMIDTKKRGISLISLIITIIVIIILAAIVIFTGLNTPDRANLAKFMQEISDFRTAITQDFMNKKAEYAISGKSRSDAQIYYAIAKSGDYTGDINEKPVADGQVASLEMTILPEGLKGTDYYEITDDKSVKEWKNNKAYYEARGISGERHFVTDEGEPFILPGYLVQENGQNKWYVNERKYYVSDNPARVSVVVNESAGKSVSELYNGINNPDDINYNEDAMHIGDWVEYDAGNWTETKAVPDWETPLTFGGYTAGQSRNTNASGILDTDGEKYEGWRIFDITGNTVTLISAGCPEGFYDMGGYIYNIESIFTGETTGTIASYYPSTPRDWSVYENEYASSGTARTLRKSGLDTWYNRYIDSMITDLSDYEKIENGYWDDEIQDFVEPRNIPSNLDNKLISLIRNGYQYTLSQATLQGDSILSYGSIVSFNDGEDDGVYGIRVLVTLKNDITFNETPTKLQKDGYSYNKWTFSN